MKNGRWDDVRKYNTESVERRNRIRPDLRTARNIARKVAEKYDDWVDILMGQARMRNAIQRKWDERRRRIPEEDVDTLIGAFKRE